MKKMNAHLEQVGSSMGGMSTKLSSVDDHVSLSITAALHLIQQQHQTLEILSKKVNEAAHAAHDQMSEFVVMNQKAMLDAKEAHEIESEQQRNMLLEMKDTIDTFNNSQRSGIQKMQECSSMRRDEMLQLSQDNLEAEKMAAQARADRCEQLAKERNEVVAKDADELMFTLTAAINAFKTKHMDACTSTAAIHAAENIDGAKKHSERMMSMLTQVSKKYEETENVRSHKEVLTV
jgi:hypothetical protein